MFQLRNPHSILAVFRTRPAAVRSVRLHNPNPGGVWRDVLDCAAERRLTVETTPGPTTRQRGERATERTGAGSALVEPPSPVPLPQVLRSSEESGPQLWLAADRIQDPQNLGALFRLAGFFGVRGLILTRSRSAPVSETVCDVAAGGVEYTPFAVVPNLAQALRTAQAANIWVLGTCERSERDIRHVARDRHWLLVMGNEAEGLRRLTRDLCDETCSLSAAGAVTSLNVATAAAACLAILSGPEANSADPNPDRSPPPRDR